jgi:transcriptional regulator GlxA family with amidase domain
MKYLKFLAFFFIAFNCVSIPASDMNKTNIETKTLGVLIFPDYELLDVFGPLEMFGHLPDKIKIVLIAEKSGPVKSYQGPSVLADVSLEDAPSIDFLLVPGGLGTRKEVHNKKLIEWIKQKAVEAEVTLSVCTGAALLAKAGLLNNRNATTNKIAFDWVATYGNNVNWVREARWVDDGNIVTSSGVAAGTDMSLYLISRLYGKKTAESLIQKTEYIWNSNPHFDPFVKNISQQEVIH